MRALPSAALAQPATRAGRRFFGATPARLRCDVAEVSEIVHPTGRTLPEHDHALDYFCLLLHGRYDETLGGKTLEYAPCQARFHPAGVPHRDRIGPDGARFVCLEIHASALATAGTRLGTSPGPLPGDAAVALLQLWQGLRTGTLAALALESVAWELCDAGEPVRAGRARPRWLARCLALIEDACEEPWTVAAAARAVGVHPVHLSREFRRRFGRTFGECVLRARVRLACARMVSTGESLAHTAAHAGFSDHSHFCRVFKATVGCTPSAFRARAARFD
jgi:AraC family transcriptional regulator